MPALRECLPPAAERGRAAAARDTIAAAQAMEASGLVVGTVGNTSTRVDEGFVITPTRAPYATLATGDLAYVALADGSCTSDAVPSREWQLHAAIYRARPDVGGIAHTHSVHATAWSFLGEPLRPATEENYYYRTGSIRTAPYAPAGTVELGENAVAALGDSAAVLLGRHGVVATGASAADAVTIARVVEHQAQVAWLLRSAFPGIGRPATRPQ